MSNTDKVRGKIVREYLRSVFDRGIEAQCLDMNLGTDEFFFNVANQILAIPEVLIKAEDQSLPPTNDSKGVWRKVEL